jgi:hypothetical protein
MRLPAEMRAAHCNMWRYARAVPRAKPGFTSQNAFRMMVKNWTPARGMGVCAIKVKKIDQN